MHTVLLVDEIFKIICENVPGPNGGLAALVALAQTCRSLQGISLDVLWGHGPMDFIDILKTLPPDSWSDIESSFVRSHFFHASDQH
jgi:hypothetical protein